MSSIITSALSPQRSAPTKRSRRKRRIVIGFLIYTVLGFFVAPAIIKWQLPKQLAAYTHRQATVKQVRANPYALSLTVRGLALTETNGTPFVGFDELYVNFQLSSLFRWAWTFSEIKVTGPTANVVRFADGQFNFSDLLTNGVSSGKPFALPPALIQQFHVTNALLTVTDNMTPTRFHTVYGPAHIEIENLSTRPDEHGPYSIVARTDDGEAFTWSGTISLNPPQSRGEFKLLNIPPAKYGPYLAHFTTTRVTRGTLDVSADYAIRIAGFPPELEVSNAAVHLRDFQLKAPVADETLLTVDDFQVKGASANLTNATVRVPLVIQKGGSAFIRRAADGGFEAEKFVHAPTNGFVLIRQLATDLQAAIKAEFRASLDELRVEDFTVTAEDQSLPATARLGLDHMNVSVKGLSNQPNAPVSVNWDANWRGGGHVQVTSTGTLLPFASEASIVVTNFALAPLQPYVESQANLTVQSGALNVTGQAHFDPADTNTPLLQFKGEVSVTNFLSSDTIAFQEFASWENLHVRGVQFQLEPNRFAVEEVKLTGLHANLVISSNGQPAVLALLKEKPAPAAAAASTTDLPTISLKSFPIKVGAVVVERGSLGAVDVSLTPHFSTRIEEFNGSVRDITFPGLTRTTIDIQGKVSALSSFTVAGTLTPDLTNPFADLKITMTNTDLTPFTPYSEKFAGYALNKGKLAFDVHYLIENRAVKGENAVTVDQLTFGAQKESPDATKLPVKLGVALLKDRNGRIALDVPVSGSLDDPSFRISGVVWQAIINVLVKAATSPFALLGALVGGGEELQYVDFEPGQAMLNDSRTNRLAKLVKALNERPALNLEISATYDPVKDVDVLGRQKVLEKMKTLRIQEIVARGKPAPSLEELQLEDDEYDRLLRQAYRDAFTTAPEAALREALAAATATNSPGETVRPSAAASPVSGQGRGAAALLKRQPSLSELEAQARAGSRNGAISASVKPRTERELVRAELEARLLSLTPVNDEDLKTLAERRIEAVQKYLVETGNVEAGRLFPLASASSVATKGEARVVFSLN